MATQSIGKVYLVGAGPGDPGLLTVRGLECLRRAHVVLHDYLVNPRILSHASPGAECVCLGQHGRSRIWSQHEINQRMIELARDGKTVVRLKGGDPGIFARGVEEISALAAAGIPFEVVPGVTAALAAGCFTGIPLTHREFASAVALVTGQEDSEKQGIPIDYSSLAGFPGTLVIYMGVTTVRQWSSQLIAGGKPGETPVAIVRRCSWPDQRIERCRLADVADRVEGSPRIRPPVIFLIGPIAGLGTTSSWFEQRPLFGQRVLVTRPADQGEYMRALLEDEGAEVFLQPAIEIMPPESWDPVDQALARLTEFDWLVFSSSNGVRFLLDRLLATRHDIRALGAVKLAAIGPGTADALAAYRLRAEVRPDEYRAERLAEALIERAATQRFLLARASRGRDVLPDQLQAAGAHVEQIVVYQSRDVTAPDPEIANKLAAREIDWITVTSSAIARSLAHMFGDRMKSAKLASISPITSATLRQLGFEPAVEATQYTIPGVVAAIRESL